MTNSDVKAESDEEMEHESIESSKSEGEDSGSDTESGDEDQVSGRDASRLLYFVRFYLFVTV